MPKKPVDLTGSVINDVDEQDLLTLANATAFIANGLAMTRGGTLLSIRGSFSLHTLAAGDGPHLCGIMNGDLTLSQLEEYLELDGPLSPSLVTESEVASRGKMIRTLGVLQPRGNGTVASFFLDNVGLSGLRFPEATEVLANSWTWWVYNLGKAMTTACLWSVKAQLFVKFNPSG